MDRNIFDLLRRSQVQQQAGNQAGIGSRNSLGNFLQTVRQKEGPVPEQIAMAKAAGQAKQAAGSKPAGPRGLGVPRFMRTKTPGRDVRFNTKGAMLHPDLTGDGMSDRRQASLRGNIMRGLLSGKMGGGGAAGAGRRGASLADIFGGIEKEKEQAAEEQAALPQDVSQFGGLFGGFTSDLIDAARKEKAANPDFQFFGVDDEAAEQNRQSWQRALRDRGYI